MTPSACLPDGLVLGQGAAVGARRPAQPPSVCRTFGRSRIRTADLPRLLRAPAHLAAPQGEAGAPSSPHPGLCRGVEPFLSSAPGARPSFPSQLRAGGGVRLSGT